MEGAGFEGEAGIMGVDGGGTGYHAYAVANLPNQSKTLGVRLVAGYEDTPGWIDDAITGEKDINGNTQAWFRGKALWQPNDTFTGTLLWQHYDLEQDNLNSSDPDDPDVVAQARSTPVEDKFDLINLILDFDLGGVNLISSTGYLDRNLKSEQDLTAFFGFLVPPGGTIGLAFDTDFKVLTQEIRLSSQGDGPLSWTAGVWYRDAESWGIRSTPATPNPVMGVLDSMATSPVDAKSWAVFGDISYAFSPQWEASVGARYYDDKRTQKGSAVTFFNPTVFNDTAKFDSVDPRFNLLWRYNDVGSAYINVAKGFRSGGFNAIGPPDTYDPEKLWNYEIGTRTGLFENRVTIDTAIFYLDYTDVQVLDVAPGAVFANTTNAGKASGAGFEFAGTALLTEQLILELSYSKNNLAFDNTTADKQKGDPLDFVPDQTWSAALTYRFNWTSTLPGMFRVDYQAASGYELNIASQGVHIKTDSTAFLNARLGMERARWQLYLEGKNLTNEDTILFPPAGIVTTATRPVPRTLGLLFRFQY
jgi:outer membrane receptor protein involved in Fe transport